MAVLVHPFTRGDASGTAAFDPAAADEPLVEASGALAPDGARPHRRGGPRARGARRAPSSSSGSRRATRLLFLQLRPYRASRAAALDPRRGARRRPIDVDVGRGPQPAAAVARAGRASSRSSTRAAARPSASASSAATSSTRPCPCRGAGRRARPTRSRALTRDADARLAALGATPRSRSALALFVAIVRAALRRRAAGGARRARRARGVPARRTRHPYRSPRCCAAFPPSPPSARAAPPPSRRRPTPASAPPPSPAYLALFGDEAPVWDVAAADPRRGRRARCSASSHASAARPTPQPAAPLAAASAAPRRRARRGRRRRGRRRPLRARAGARPSRAAARGPAPAAPRTCSRAPRTSSGCRSTPCATRAARSPSRSPPSRTPSRRRAKPTPPRSPIRRRSRERTPRTTICARAACAAAPPLAAASWVRVHLHDPTSAAPVPPGAILVARTLLPTELPLLAPAAIVVETGGVLGHVAAQARERGLPAIVDAPGALTAFRAGDRVLVDGDAGIAIRLGRPDAAPTRRRRTGTRG